MHTHQGELVRSRNGLICDCRLLPNARLVVGGTRDIIGSMFGGTLAHLDDPDLSDQGKGVGLYETGPFSTRSS